MKALVADDSKIMRLLLTSLLCELGIEEVDDASNGTEAFQMATEKCYDFVILDIHMPKMSGISVLRTLKTESSRCSETLVIMVSSDNSYRTIEKAKELGAFGYIQKPFKKESLVAAVNAVRMLREPHD